ncbi:Hypothetical predicted protein [Marmota monax]|uniref:Septin-type G domain-containing protein n=1 Tax=Marmota monax TaxID=9995 RepID=A0A5E4BXP0_MARMO|nr:Hypothetical predicted protein [Marmota monax]
MHLPRLVYVQAIHSPAAQVCMVRVKLLQWRLPAWCAAAANEELRNLSLSGHVGFDSLPDQLVNKSTSQGFCFNILCVGETGIGKSTLMDTLFNTKFESDPATHNEPGVRLKARSYELQESNVRLKLTIVDTVGFGDQINKDDRGLRKDIVKG